MVMLLAFIIVPSGFGMIDDHPSDVHLTWSTGDTSHSITVSWMTISPSESYVLYDSVSRGVPENYTWSAQGVTHSNEEISGIFHDVSLTGLQPNTTYFFIIGSDLTGWSQEKRFTTLPETRSNVRFIAGGDSRTNPELRDQISEGMAEYSPDFVLFSGDFVVDGWEDDLWDNFFKHMDETWITPTGDMIPVVPARGNHDTGSENYVERFALPGNEYWYSLNIGSDIHIVVLDSEAGIEEFNEQTEWLKQDLEQHKDYPWKIVLFHRNVFRNYHEEWLAAFNNWVPLFDEYNVDLVIQGHSHNYVRSNPVNWTISRTEPQSDYNQGTLYLVSGGWGAPLYEPVDGWWVAYNTSQYHFTLIDLDTDGTLTLQAINERGEVFDQLSYQKQLPSEAELLLNRYKKVTEKIEELDDFIWRLGQKNTEKNQIIEELESLLNEIETIKEALGSENLEYITQIDQLEGQVEDLRTEIQGLQAQLDEFSLPEEEISSSSIVLFPFIAVGIGVGSIFVILKRRR